jgi:hypothetical protein
MTHVHRDCARERGRPLTASPLQITTQPHHQQRKHVRFVGPASCEGGRGAVARLFGSSMHFSFYLVVTALVILGVEVAYALYQLVNLTL